MNITRWVLLLVVACPVLPAPAAADTGTPAQPHYRVLVSTDIGGTDFDDFQSMVHLLLYADSVDIEGLVSSPYGPGRKEHILTVIQRYERDYQNLKSYSDKYPTPDALRALTKQGAIDVAGSAGFGTPTEGSEWIVRAARRTDPRPLCVLVWGGIEDLAQALHDAPDILPKLRVYFIGGPNKKWSVDAYHYIATHHPRLWIIEANATYRGWFTGGNQSGEWGNTPFVAAHIAGHGALGDFFAAQLQPTIKMGDTPSVGWLLHGTPEDPSQPGWGGQFVRAWERPYRVFDRLTTASDEIEQFGVFELALPIGDHAPGRPEARIQIENQSLTGFLDAKGAMRFRFSPKDAKVYGYTIRANTPALDGSTGALTSVRPPPDAALRPSPRLPNWWTDDPAPAVAEGVDLGAKTVSRWRDAFLRDFAARMLRCKTPAPMRLAEPRAAKLTNVEYGQAGGEKLLLDFQTKLRASGVRADLIVLPGAAHRLTEWHTFMPDHGARLMAWLREVLAVRGTGAGKPPRWTAALLHQKPEWYASAEARAVAGSVMQFQSPHGGWPKNTDLATPPRGPEDTAPFGADTANSLDNGATTTPMRFLALVVQATGDARHAEAFTPGVDYLLAAQYPNGGWPQFFPLREGYYSRITYNDDAMVNVLTVLRDAAASKPPYVFVDERRRSRAGAAVARGIDIILRTQVTQDGKLTAWCAQHDETTLAPAWARDYEPPSLSGSESVGIVRFLMGIERPTTPVVAAIDGAVAWLRSVAIHGLRLEDFTGADGTRDRRVVADPGAESLWARFYELRTSRPIFLGRDSVVRYAFSEIEHERRNGYAYYGTWPAVLLAEDYPRWRAKHKTS